MKTTPVKWTPPAEEPLFHALLRAPGWLRQLQDPYFARFGISGSQWGILRVLQRAELQGETVLPLKTVSERLVVRPPSVTRVVDRLESMGLVKRTLSAGDMRVRHLSLTSSGRDLLARVLESHADRTRRLMEPLQPGERDQMFLLLQRLEAHWKAMAAPPVDATATAARDS